MPDGRLNLTAVPLLYGSYTSTDATGTLNLEPPADLNISAGLPILNQAAVDEADQRYSAQLKPTGIAPRSPTLMRVQRTEAIAESAIPVARAEPVPPKAVPTQIDGRPVARALPVNADQSTIPVARAEPVDPGAVPVAPLQPFATPVPSVVSALSADQWTVYKPGRMPRGRLLGIDAAGNLPAEDTGAVQYLAGDFQVSAAGQSRAVLRGSGGQQNIRVIVDFPGNIAPPAEGETVQRDAQRPFQITNVERGPDGQINVYAREITRP